MKFKEAIELVAAKACFVVDDSQKLSVRFLNAVAHPFRVSRKKIAVLRLLAFFGTYAEIFSSLDSLTSDLDSCAS